MHRARDILELNQNHLEKSQHLFTWSSARPLCIFDGTERKGNTWKEKVALPKSPLSRYIITYGTICSKKHGPTTSFVAVIRMTLQ